MNKNLFKWFSVFVIGAMLFGFHGVYTQTAQASAQPESTHLLNADQWWSNNGGGGCDDNHSTPLSSDDCCEDDDGHGDSVNHGDDPKCTPSPEPTNTGVPQLTATISYSPTPKSSPTPDDTATTVPTSTRYPTKMPTSTLTNIPTVTKTATQPPLPTFESSTPTRTPIPATATLTAVPTTTSTIPTLAFTPTATAVVVNKPHGKSVSAPTCDSSDKVLADNGKDIFWFDSKLGSKVNITESLGGINTHGHFDPTAECPSMVFLHADNAGSAPEIWIYDGTFYQIQNEGMPIQANVVRWSAKDILAFTADGYLKTVGIDGTNLMDLDMYGVNMIDWSPDGEILAVTNDDHAVFFMNPHGEIMATHSDSFMSELKWMPDESQICGGERCIYIETLTEGSFVLDAHFAKYIAYDPANGAKFVLSDENRMAIYQTENFVEGTWMNLDWYSINKAPRQLIKFPAPSSTPGVQAIQCPSIVTSYTGISLHDFMWMARVDLTQEELALLCGIEDYHRTADQNIKLLNLIRAK